MGAELISDKSTLKVVNGKVRVKRIVEEDYDFELFLRTLDQMKEKIGFLEDDQEEIQRMVDLFSTLEEDVNDLRGKEIEGIKEEIKTAVENNK